MKKGLILVSVGVWLILYYFQETIRKIIPEEINVLFTGLIILAVGYVMVNGKVKKYG